MDIFRTLGSGSLSVTAVFNFSGKANTSIHGLGVDDTARGCPHHVHGTSPFSARHAWAASFLSFCCSFQLCCGDRWHAREVLVNTAPFDPPGTTHYLPWGHAFFALRSRGGHADTGNWGHITTHRKHLTLNQCWLNLLIVLDWLSVTSKKPHNVKPMLV